MAVLEMIRGWVVGSALSFLLCLIIGLVFVAAWRKLRREMSLSMMVVFLAFAVIATVEAQKVKYVDASASGRNSGESWGDAYTSLQSAVRALSGIEDAGMVYVKAGTYAPIFVDADWFKYTQILTPNAMVVAVDGPHETIIDAKGTGSCFEHIHGNTGWMYFEGFTFANGKVGVDGTYGEAISNCIVSNCEYGVVGVGMVEQSLIVNNSEVGILNAEMVEDSTVANNGVGISGECVWIDRTIVWGNGIECFGPESPYNLGDPLFVDASHGDFRLSMGSPCINAVGANSWQDYDLSGNPRIARGYQDLGCYEYQPTNDHQTITAPIPVEFDWIREKCPDVLSAVAGDYDKAVLERSANPAYSIWETYLADISPTDTNAEWHAEIKMVGNEPIVKAVPESPKRKYTVVGKEKLTDPEWLPNNDAARFFKVRVELK